MRRIDETPKGTSLDGTASIGVQHVGVERSGSAVRLPNKSTEKKTSRTLSRVGAVALYTVLWTVVVQYRK
jgi:hypothetical protein